MTFADCLGGNAPSSAPPRPRPSSSSAHLQASLSLPRERKIGVWRRTFDVSNCIYISLSSAFPVHSCRTTLDGERLAHPPHFLPTTVPVRDGSASHAGIGAKNDRQVLHQVHGQKREPPGVEGKAGAGGKKGRKGSKGSRGEDRGKRLLKCLEWSANH